MPSVTKRLEALLQSATQDVTDAERSLNTAQRRLADAKIRERTLREAIEASCDEASAAPETVKVTKSAANGRAPASRVQARLEAMKAALAGGPLGPQDLTARLADRGIEVSRFNVTDTLRRFPDNFQPIGNGRWTLKELLGGAGRTS